MVLVSDESTFNLKLHKAKTKKLAIIMENLSNYPVRYIYMYTTYMCMYMYACISSYMCNVYIVCIYVHIHI